MVKVNKELQDTLLSHPEVNKDGKYVIGKVYFDAQGRHYFNVFKLQPEKDSKEEKLYGAGMFSHFELLKGNNPDKLKEQIAIGDPNTLITDTLTREEVLDMEVKVEGDDIFAEFANMSPEKLAALKGLLGLTPSATAASVAPKKAS